MKKIILGLALTTSIGLVLDAQARTLAPYSDWAVRKVDSDIPYCTISKQYEGDIDLTIAKNADQEGTIAFNFNETVFDVGRPYALKMFIDSVAREYYVRPISGQMVIVRFGQDSTFMDALASGKRMNVQIDSERFSLPMSGYRDILGDVSSCLGNQAPKQLYVETKTAVPPQLYAEADTAADGIDRLIDENADLLAQVSKAKPTQNPVSHDMGEIADLEARNLELQRQIANLENNQAMRAQDSAESIARQQAQIQSLSAQNERLKAELDASMQYEQENSDQANNVNAQLTNKLAELEQQNTRLRSQLSEAQAEASMLKTQRQTENSSESKMVELEEQNLALQAQLEAMQAEIVAAQRRAPPGKQGASIDVAEARVKALTLRAERDEYQRLLQLERRRIAQSGGNTAPSSDNQNLVRDIKRLEAEKAELIRELSFTTSRIEALEGDVHQANTNVSEEQIEKLMNDLRVTEEELENALQDKENLRQQMVEMDNASLDLQRQMANAGAQSDQVKRLEAEKRELEKLLSSTTTRIEELEMQTAQTQQPSSQEMDRLIASLQSTQAELSQALAEQDRLRQQVGAVDTQADALRQQLAQMKVQDIAQDDVEKIQDDLDTKTMQAEIASLEVQNKILREKQNTQRRAAKRVVSRPILPQDNQPKIRPQYQSQHQSQPQTQKRQTAVVLSGDKIRQLLSESKIPLQTNVNRVQNISRSDFAAFQWDTGFVFGSGEQARLGSPESFDSAVQNYLQKISSRCQGSFDQNIETQAMANGVTVKSADVACVDTNAQGHAASILFFEHQGMFYAMAHEADMDGFTVAMDMRDRLKDAVTRTF